MSDEPDKLPFPPLLPIVRRVGAVAVVVVAGIAAAQLHWRNQTTPQKLPEPCVKPAPGSQAEKDGVPCLRPVSTKILMRKPAAKTV